MVKEQKNTDERKTKDYKINVKVYINDRFVKLKG